MVLGESLSLIINQLSVFEVIPMIELVVKYTSVTRTLTYKKDVENLMNNLINSLEQAVGEMEHVYMQLKN